MSWEDFYQGRAMARNPAYARHILHQEELERLQAQKEAIRSDLADKISKIYGESGRPAVGVTRPGAEPIMFKGTGLLGHDMPEMQRALIERNRDFLSSGNQILQEAALKDLVPSMQKSIMTGFKDAGTKDPGFNEWVNMSPEQREMLANYYQAKRPPTSSVNVNTGPGGFVSPDTANKLEYLESGKRVLPYTPVQSLVGKVKSVTTQENKDKSKQATANSVLDQYQSMLFGKDGIYTGEKNNPLDRAMFMVKSNVERFTQSDPRFRSYHDFVLGAASPLAKALGEAGTLATEDVDRVIKGLSPNITGLFPDSPDVAKEKLIKLNELINKSASGAISVDDVNKAISSINYDDPDYDKQGRRLHRGNDGQLYRLNNGAWELAK